MTAAGNLARWRVLLDAGLTPVSHTVFRTFARRRKEALPALLAFAEAMLAWADRMEASAEAIYASWQGDAAAVNHAETARHIRQLAEKHLGGVR